MPPNVTNSPSSGDQQVRNRKTLVNGKTDESRAPEIKECKERTAAATQKSSIFGKIVNFFFYLSIFMVIFVAAFVFLPWEEYIFDEHELENYIDMYTEGDGDWVVRQFLATAEQNLSEPM